MIPETVHNMFVIEDKDLSIFKCHYHKLDTPRLSIGSSYLTLVGNFSDQILFPFFQMARKYKMAKTTVIQLTVVIK